MKITGPLRKDDVVAVRAVVRFDVDPNDDNVHVRLDRWHDTRVPLADVLSIEERVWRIGERVRNVNDHEDRGRVIAVHGTVAWVKTPGKNFMTIDSLCLEPDPWPETDAELRERLLEKIAEEAIPGEPLEERKEAETAAGEALDKIVRRFGLERCMPGSHGEGDPAETEGV
jgi:hypothetical protein